jgi:amino acid transporter
VGWVLVVGYVWVMAMYAYAFGAYTLVALREIFSVTLPGLLRPVLSTGVIAIFVGLNLIGVEETGFVEDITVYFKVLLLLTLAVLGTIYADVSLGSFDFFNEGVISPISAFAIIFVSYEGFQLLTYDYQEIENVDRNLERGMYIAIAIAIVIYVSVSLMATLNLSPELLQKHKETALAKAVSKIPFLGEIGFILVIISAIKSTSSGINATLFGTARLTHRIATEEVLPRGFSFRDRRGVPVYSLLLMGGLTALLTTFGTLTTITEFGSVAFLMSFTVTNYVNLKLSDETESWTVIPAFGLLGTNLALPILIWHLYQHEFWILIYILILFVSLFLFEYLYMTRTAYRDIISADYDNEQTIE